MDKFYHSVRLDESLCKGCITCIKRCPTEAIRVRDGKAWIKNGLIPPKWVIGASPVEG